MIPVSHGNRMNNPNKGRRQKSQSVLPLIKLSMEPLTRSRQPFRFLDVIKKGTKKIRAWPGCGLNESMAPDAMDPFIFWWLNIDWDNGIGGKSDVKNPCVSYPFQLQFNTQIGPRNTKRKKGARAKKPRACAAIQRERCCYRFAIHSSSRCRFSSNLLSARLFLNSFFLPIEINAATRSFSAHYLSQD